MCGPALGLVGAAVSAVGSIASANAQASGSESQAKMAEYNAQVERINARSQRQKGFAEQEQIAAKYEKLEGQGIAAAAKGGVDPGYGSAALTIFGANNENKYGDMETAFVNAEGQAVAHENKAKQYDFEAEQRRQEASAQKKGGMISAGSSFLNGLAGAVKGGGGLGITPMING